MSQTLQGIIPPLVTPFKDDETMDEPALRENERFMLRKKVHGICLGGSTGEGHTI